MCQAHTMVIRGWMRRGMTALVALIVIAAGLTACGGDEEPAQAPAPAETGAGETESSAATASTTPGERPESGEPAADPVDDEADIVKTLDAVLAGSDPAAACSDSVTERFLRRSYGDASGCEAAQSGAKPAKDAGVKQVVIHPDSVAQALARPEGGIYDGQELRAELVLDDDVWKLDSLRSNVPVGP